MTATDDSPAALRRRIVAGLDLLVGGRGRRRRVDAYDPDAGWRDGHAAGARRQQVASRSSDRSRRVRLGPSWFRTQTSSPSTAIAIGAAPTSIAGPSELAVLAGQTADGAVVAVGHPQHIAVHRHADGPDPDRHRLADRTGGELDGRDARPPARHPHPLPRHGQAHHACRHGDRGAGHAIAVRSGARVAASMSPTHAPPPSTTMSTSAPPSEIGERHDRHRLLASSRVTRAVGIRHPHDVRPDGDGPRRRRHRDGLTDWAPVGGVEPTPRRRARRPPPTAPRPPPRRPTVGHRARPTTGPLSISGAVTSMSSAGESLQAADQQRRRSAATIRRRTALNRQRCRGRPLAPAHLAAPQPACRRRSPARSPGRGSGRTPA